MNDDWPPNGHVVAPDRFAKGKTTFREVLLFLQVERNRRTRTTFVESKARQMNENPFSKRVVRLQCDAMLRDNRAETDELQRLIAAKDSELHKERNVSRVSSLEKREFVSSFSIVCNWKNNFVCKWKINVESKRHTP